MQIKIKVLVKNINGDNMILKDFKKSSVRTDLLSEVYDANENTIYEEISKLENIKIRRICLNEENASLLNKKKGCYVTIEFDDITDYDNFTTVKKYLKQELSKFLLLEKTLFIGLGNINSTPDSLGVKTVNNILVTSYLKDLGPLEEGFNETAIFTPSVKGITGLDTSKVISSIISLYNPKQVVIIDSLVSSSSNRVTKTIQITDSGITPYESINNYEFNFDDFNIPIIVIGVPTALELSKLGMIVTVKDIDFQIERFSLLISSAINEIIHPKLK